jgi:hypothetical protein
MCEERVHVTYVPPELPEPRQAVDAKFLLRRPYDVVGPGLRTKALRVHEPDNQHEQGSTP